MGEKRSKHSPNNSDSSQSLANKFRLGSHCHHWCLTTLHECETLEVALYLCFNHPYLLVDEPCLVSCNNSFGCGLRKQFWNFSKPLNLEQIWSCHCGCYLVSTKSEHSCIVSAGMNLQKNHPICDLWGDIVQTISWWDVLLCLDRTSADRVMREVHARVCGPHMGGHMLTHKIMRANYFWLTMETDCFQFVQRCPKCQMHENLIHIPHSELHTLTLPWPFSVWGIDIIGEILSKCSNCHEFILVAIDYFTKWEEVASYARLTSARVASFIRSHIICRYGVPHELISDRGVHFGAEVDTLLQRYGIQHHRSSAYRS